MKEGPTNVVVRIKGPRDEIEDRKRPEERPRKYPPPLANEVLGTALDGNGEEGEGNAKCRTVCGRTPVVAIVRRLGDCCWTVTTKGWLLWWRLYDDFE
ncbi:MAG: hypothetical protein M1837_002676, partial [Sclerophora amabilis]